MASQKDSFTLRDWMSIIEINEYGWVKSPKSYFPYMCNVNHEPFCSSVPQTNQIYEGKQLSMPEVENSE